MNVGEFLDHCRTALQMNIASDAGSSSTALSKISGHDTGIYAKDTECPQPWSDWLLDAAVIPEPLKPLNPNDLFGTMPPSVSLNDELHFTKFTFF
jgi:hypothetical protein